MWRDQRGSIYVEALVAIAILAIALIPLIGTWFVTPGAQAQAGQQMVAMNLARAKLEAAHALTPTEWDSLASSSEVVERSGLPYTIVSEVTSPTDAGLNAHLKHLRVVVSWTNARGTVQQVVLTTSVARRS